MPLAQRPRAVLFDLFETLVQVPMAEAVGMPTVPEVLGVPADDWDRLYYREDVLGRCLGHARDPVDIMRRVAHRLDPNVAEDRIQEAVRTRSSRFEMALVNVEPGILAALDALRATGVRTALVSDAGTDDVAAWDDSPLRHRLDHVVFSHAVGVRKPDPRIYSHALRGVDVAAAEAVFVGDGGSDEHRGARGVGLATVIVTRFASRWPDLVASRIPHADHAFDDVPAFVAALPSR